MEPTCVDYICTYWSITGACALVEAISRQMGALSVGEGIIHYSCKGYFIGSTQL
jgi:hypothetical protein